VSDVTNIIAVVLTLMVLSRILGDNPVFRAAQYLFVGASLGLAFVVAYHQVLRPTALELAAGSNAALLLYGVPLALGLLLLPRISGGQSLSWAANIPLALVFGVGSALAVGGAIIGTLLPQILDTARPLGGDGGQVAGAIVLALGTIITLSAFFYTAPSDTAGGRVVAAAGMLGHWLLMVAFGFFFAGAVQTYLSALTERLGFVIGTIQRLFGI
jgi:hypothetical protein